MSLKNTPGLQDSSRQLAHTRMPSHLQPWLTFVSDACLPKKGSSLYAHAGACDSSVNGELGSLFTTDQRVPLAGTVAVLRSHVLGPQVATVNARQGAHCAHAREGSSGQRVYTREVHIPVSYCLLTPCARSARLRAVL